MKLEIWYQQTPANDYGEGDPALLVSNTAELDALLDRVIADSQPGPVWPMIEVSLADDPDSPVIQAGLGADRGFMAYLAEDGGWSQGDTSRTGFVEYDYMGSVSEIPASAEVPVQLVRDGLREFLETGMMPQSVTWQDPYPHSSNILDH